MGYHTTFELSWGAVGGDPLKDPPSLDLLRKVSDWIMAQKVADPWFLHPLTSGGSSVQEAKWYDDERWPQMYRLSKQFPNLLFELYGVGQEAEDQWIEYWLDGRLQEAPAFISFDDFDPELLTEIDPAFF